MPCNISNGDIIPIESVRAGKGRPCRRTMCKDGWFDLLDMLCERLQFRTDRNQAPQVVISQVKEKGGELAFYCHGGDQE